MHSLNAVTYSNFDAFVNMITLKPLCFPIITHLPHALVPPALLYYCPIAKPPLPPILAFHPGPAAG